MANDKDKIIKKIKDHDVYKEVHGNRRITGTGKDGEVKDKTSKISDRSLHTTYADMVNFAADEMSTLLDGTRAKTKRDKKREEEYEDIHNKSSNQEEFGDEDFEHIDKPAEFEDDTPQQTSSSDFSDIPDESISENNDETNKKEDYTPIGNGQGLTAAAKTDKTVFKSLTSYKTLKNNIADVTNAMKRYNPAENILDRDEMKRNEDFANYLKENEYDSIAKRKPVGTAEDMQENTVESTNRKNREALRQAGSKIGNNIANEKNTDREKIGDDYKDVNKNNEKNSNKKLLHRSHEEILVNARRNVGENTKRLVTGYMADVSDDKNNELTEDFRSARNSTRAVLGSTVRNIATAKVARNKLADRRFYGIGEILGDKDQKIHSLSTRVKSKKELEQIKSHLGDLTASKYGQDITKLTSWQLKDFAKQGKEQKLVADYLKTVRDAEKFLPENPTNLYSAAKGAVGLYENQLKQATGNSEFFSGFRTMKSATPISLSRRIAKDSGKYIKEAVNKRFAKATEGYMRQAHGIGPAGKETFSERLGRKLHKREANPVETFQSVLNPQKASAKKKNLKTSSMSGGDMQGAARASETPSIGHQRTVDNKHGKILKNKKGGAFSGKSTRSVGKNAVQAASTAANAGASGSQLAAVKKVSENVAKKTVAKFLANTAIGQGLVGIANTIGVSTGGIGYIVMAIIAAIAFIVCLMCSCGINDLFSTGTPFTINIEDKVTNDPDESYGAETMYLLDAYLARNYEYICKRGLEEEITKSMKGENTMSIKEPFTVEMQGTLNYNATGDDDLGMTEEDVAAMEEAIDSGNFEGEIGDSTALGKAIKFDAGKVSVVTHKAEERVTSKGEDVSTPDRFVISFINGVKAEYETPESSTSEAKIEYAKAKEFLNEKNPSLVERYVYDVESHNSIFYTDIDHSIVPDIGNIIPVTNEKTYDQKNGAEASEKGYSTLKSGELTPLDNAVFDNTKEIISMALTAFDNNFVMDSEAYGGAYKNQVNGKQFETYCYKMWLKSHYVDLNKEGKKLEKVISNNTLPGAFGDKSTKLESLLENYISCFYLTNIHPFGEIKNNFEKGYEADVNYITPFNKFHYSPELYHYGLYQLADEGQGIMLEADDFSKSNNHKPNVIESTSMQREQKIAAGTLQNTDVYYDPENGTAHHILASKLPILNIKSEDKLKFEFDGLNSLSLGKTDKASITSGEKDGESFTELKDTISTASTINYRYFKDANTLIRETSTANKADIPVTNENSFVYNEAFTIEHEAIISKSEEFHTNCEVDGKDAYYDDYSTDDYVLEKDATKDTDFNTVKLEGVNDRTALQKVLDDNNLAEKLENIAKNYRTIEKSYMQAFYNAFGTNTGIDKDEAYTYPKYTTMSYTGDTPTFKTSQKINYGDTLLTNCGDQEGYAGSPLLNAISGDKYPTKGNKDIIMSVLEETSEANKLITDEGEVVRELGEAYYNGNLVDVMHEELDGNLYNYDKINDIVGQGDAEVPVVIMTQGGENTKTLDDAKALMKDYYRGILVYVEYNDTLDVCTAYCDGPCDYCDDNIGDDGEQECNCSKAPKECTKLKKNDESDRVAVQYKITIIEYYPQAEFVGFYLCGGHTQIAIMPVTLSMTGSTTLFDIEFKSDEFNTLTTGSYLRNDKVITALHDIWDTSSSQMVNINGTETSFDKVAKQNRINAVEALGDSWEDRYMIDYAVLKAKSDDIAEKLAAKSQKAKTPFYSPTPSNLRPTKARTATELATKYKIGGKGADSSAVFISSEDMSTILTGVKEELIAKIGDDAPTLPAKEGSLDNEYDNRLERVSRALSKVGKIGYSQVNHQWSTVSPITGGDGKTVDYNDIMYKTDCSGFCSWVVGFGLHKDFGEDGAYVDNIINGVNYTKASFTTANRAALTNAGYTEHYSFDTLKPGDLAFKEGHVVMYAYTKDGITYYVDCTSAGGKLGNGGVEFAGMASGEFASKYSKGYVTVDYDVYPSESQNLEESFITP